MRIPKGLFVIGGGGREHALVWHLRRYYPDSPIYCAPGNPGVARLATCLPIPTSDLDALTDAVTATGARTTIVGPEAPLVSGIADRLTARGLDVIGPDAAGAALEGSKAFAKAVMRSCGVPTAEHATFEDLTAALDYIEQSPRPLVVKADGLAAGKGVVVCDGPREAREAARAMLADGAFGAAGRRIVIEERLEGEEVSVFAIVDGEACALLPAAQDHKRVGDGDRGPNTGGMGAAGPVRLSASLRSRILREIIEPVAHAMCAMGHPYRGVLFAGLMLTPEGAKVLEFNCRLGDPEAQVVLPLLEVGLLEAFGRLRAGRLAPAALAAPDGAAVGVVLAAAGYPASPQVGQPIDGIGAAEAHGLVFHAGTALREGRPVTAGGRVLTVVGRDATPAAAQARAYRAVADVRFEGMHFRRDIGARLLGASGAGAAPGAGGVSVGARAPVRGR